MAVKRFKIQVRWHRKCPQDVVNLGGRWGVWDRQEKRYINSKSFSKGDAKRIMRANNSVG